MLDFRVLGEFSKRISGIVSGKLFFGGIEVDNSTALKQVSLLINAPSPSKLGSGRLTAMWNVTIEAWISNAAAVLSGTWGAVTRRSHQSGYSRTALYMHAHRVVQAVASEQAGGISYDALWQENERLKAENEALWQAWFEAEDLSEAKQRDVAGSGCAMGLSLSQIITLLAIVLPWGAVPSRAMVGRWVQEAAAQAGRLLVVLDLACQARVRVLCLDEIFLPREPVSMAIEPNSMAWMAGQRGPDRSGESWREVISNWPCLEHVIADGGQGLERGVKLANEARCVQGEASETVSRQAMTMGLDVFHTQRELERVIQRQWKQAERQLETASQADAKVERYKRQGSDPRGVSGVAGRAWRKAEALFDQAVNAQEAVHQIEAALSWFDARGRLYCRQTAQAQLDEASQQLQGDCWSKVKRLLSDDRTLSHLDQLSAHLASAVSEPVLRDALTRLWYVHDQMRQAQGDACVRLRQLVVIEQVLCERLCTQWQSAYRRVDELLRHAVRASSAVECVNSVVRMHQGRHRHVSQGLLDLKRLYWNCRVFSDGKRKGQSPYDLLGLHLPNSDWLQLLQMDPEELEQKLLTQ